MSIVALLLSWSSLIGCGVASDHRRVLVAAAASAGSSPGPPSASTDAKSSGPSVEFARRAALLSRSPAANSSAADGMGSDNLGVPEIGGLRGDRESDLKSRIDRGDVRAGSSLSSRTLRVRPSVTEMVRDKRNERAGSGLAWDRTGASVGSSGTAAGTDRTRRSASSYVRPPDGDSKKPRL